MSDLSEAFEFFDKVQGSSQDDRAAVGKDHIQWVLKAARAAIEEIDNLRKEIVQLKAEKMVEDEGW